VEWKKSFEVRSKQIYGQHRSSPDKFKKEDWTEQPEHEKRKSFIQDTPILLKKDWIQKLELRKSFIQYLGDYISKFREIGWNHGNNVIYLFLLIYLFQSIFFFLKKKLFIGNFNECSHL